MPARSRRAPAPPARRQVSSGRAGRGRAGGRGPGAGGQGTGRGAPTAESLPPWTRGQVGPKPGAPARPAHLQSGVPAPERRAGWGPSFWAGGARPGPATPGPRSEPAGAGRRGAGRAEKGPGGERGRSGGAGAPARPAPPVLPAGPGDALRGKRGRCGGPRVGERVAARPNGASHTWALPGWAVRSRPGGALARPSAAGAPVPAAPVPAAPRVGRARRPLAHHVTFRGSHREVSVWKLGVGRGTRNASLPNPMAPRHIFFPFCEGGGVSIP